MGQQKGTILKDGLKTCSCCLQEKKAGSFGSNHNKHDRLHHHCRECRRRYGLRRRHGISHIDYLNMVQQQDGKCGICDANVDEFIVHTNPETKSLYLICHACRNSIYSRRGTLATNGVKKCSKCLIEKSINDFPKAASCKDGYSEGCKECQRARHLRRSYGISPRDYERMVEQQGDRCDCCRLTKEECGHPNDKYWFIDHCHKTGRIRGLVCHSCNLLIGHAEALKNMPNVFDYLSRHADVPDATPNKPLSA